MREGLLLTDLVFRRLRRSQNACFKCLVVKFNEDDRYSDLDMATHDGQKVAAIKAARLDDVYDAAKDYDVIGVDEGQFVSKHRPNFFYKHSDSLTTC
jgi:thymidine kinase